MIELRKFITRQMLINEPEALFVFGDNLKRAGLGGQAKEMRGEPNAVGIPTKRWPTMERLAFFTNEDHTSWREVVAPAFLKLVMFEGKIVWPADGIGTGLAQLETRAPLIYKDIGRLFYVLTTV